MGSLRAFQIPMKAQIGCLLLVVLLSGACVDSSRPADERVEAQPPDQIVAATSLDRGSCNPNLEPTSSDEEAIRQVLNSEGIFVVAQDIDTLMKLWADGSQIADAKNTPDVSDDDQIWQDKDAIRHRYVRIVFPGAPSVAQPSNLDITINGSEAVVIATTNIGDEISPFGDEWRLLNDDGCWLIKSLTYNLEKK